MNVSTGLDIGTIQTKTVAFVDEAQETASAYLRRPLIQEAQGMAEQDQELILQSVCTAIREVVKRLLSDTIIQFVSLSSAVHGLILLDEEETPLFRMITWTDNRTADEAGKLKYTALGKELYRRTGIPIHPTTPLNKIR